MDKKIGSLNFQAIAEVSKPLASAAKIANRGNIIVMDGVDGKSFIYNKASKTKVPLRQENNVYVMDVEYMAEAPFQRPA